METWKIMQQIFGKGDFEWETSLGNILSFVYHHRLLDTCSNTVFHMNYSRWKSGITPDQSESYLHCQLHDGEALQVNWPPIHAHI